jgi:hypothetical protein
VPPASFTWPLTPLADSIWTASVPIRFAGAWFPHVMTVVQSRTGSLLLHSPCELSAGLSASLKSLGPVENVVAPNWFHDLYLAEYRAAFPTATFWGPPGLQKALGARIIDRVLDGGSTAPWFEELPHATIKGLLTFDESVFFHVRTRTLIVADFLMNLSAVADAPAFTRFAFRISRADTGLQVFPILRWLSVSNRAALRRAAEQMLEWRPEQIVVGHGNPITQDTLPRLHVAFRWLVPHI